MRSQAIAILVSMLIGVALVWFFIWDIDRREQKIKDCVKTQAKVFSKVYKDPVKIVTESKIYCEGKL